MDFKTGISVERGDETESNTLCQHRITDCLELDFNSIHVCCKENCLEIQISILFKSFAIKYLEESKIPGIWSN